MQIAYFDCFSGISGDMTLGALIDAGADLSLVQSAIASMELREVTISVSNAVKRGFRGKLLNIEHPPEHSHRYLRDILGLLRRARITSSAKDLGMRIFERMARAEAKVHGTTVDRVQFHEVGAIDSIVDIVGVAVAWDSLNIQKAFASPVPTGVGQVRIAHGLVSVPAPATAELLIGVPIAPTQIPLEMTTPTGAAIITELATEFGPMPPMQVGRIGYGAGRKEMPDRANLLRVLIGNAMASPSKTDDSILVMETNLDDVTGEQIGFAIDRLWQAGALDVFTTSIQMKKNRPGVLLTVLANPIDKTRMESILFQQTGTLGIRSRKQSRSILPRNVVSVKSPWGEVSGKVSKLPSGAIDFSPEHDDCSKIAVRFGLRLIEVVRSVELCFAEENKADLLSSLDAAEAIFAPKKTDFLIDSMSLAKANTDFQQAALEDELDSVASNRISLEVNAGANSNSIEAPPETSDKTGLSHKEVEMAPEEPQGYYRWDSSPWALDEPANSETLRNGFQVDEHQES